MTEVSKERPSVTVLRECIDLQIKKGQDYQNPNSNVVQAMHYRRGIDTIHDVMQGKMLRAQSLLEAAQNTDNNEVRVNFESLEDTYKDLINYASFAVSWLRYQIDGQDRDRDIFNRKRALPQTASITLDGPVGRSKVVAWGLQTEEQPK